MLSALFRGHDTGMVNNLPESIGK